MADPTGQPPNKRAKTAAEATDWAALITKHLNRNICTVGVSDPSGPGTITLTRAEFDALTTELDTAREAANRNIFTQPRTLTDEQKAQLPLELTHLSQNYHRQLNSLNRLLEEAPKPLKALPEVSSYPYRFRLDDTNILTEFEAIQTKIKSLLENYIDLDKARTVVPIGMPEDMNDIAAHFTRWASSDEWTRMLLLAYVNTRLCEYVFCPPGPHAHWARPAGTKSRKEGPWVVTQWDVGFGLSAFRYFDEIEDPVRNNFPELLPEMHELRARMATFLDRVHGDLSWDQHAQALDDVFGREIALMVGDDPVNQNGYLTGALGIVQDAFDLAIKLKRARADWVFVREGGEDGTRKRQLFDLALPALGEGVDRGGAVVTVVPGLVRVGEEGGDHLSYTDPPTVLRQMTVLWERPDPNASERVRNMGARARGFP